MGMNLFLVLFLGGVQHVCVVKFKCKCTWNSLSDVPSSSSSSSLNVYPPSICFLPPSLPPSLPPLPFNTPSLPPSFSIFLSSLSPPSLPPSLPIQTVDVNFDRDTVLKCGNSSTPAANNNSHSLGWALNERASENTPGFRLRQHVRCFLGNSLGEGAGNGTCCGLPLLVQTMQYSVDIGL